MPHEMASRPDDQDCRRKGIEVEQSSTRSRAADVKQLLQSRCSSSSANRSRVSMLNKFQSGAVLNWISGELEGVEQPVSGKGLFVPLTRKTSLRAKPPVWMVSGVR